MIAQALGGRGGSYLFQILECILGSCLLYGKKERTMLVRLIMAGYIFLEKLTIDNFENKSSNSLF